MRVFVTGGTGYVGKVMVDKLVEDGHQVVVLQRPGTTRPASNRRAQLISGDLFDLERVQEAMCGVDAVIHLVGIIRESPRRQVTMHRVHVEGTKAVVNAAKSAGVTRFLHMSAVGARPNAVSSYHKSKWEAETHVRASGLDCTVFRPSVVFGKGGPGPEFVGQLADLVRTSPLVPVIGNGRFRLQPVSVETVAQAFANALTKDDSIGKTYELGGPEVISYVDILGRIAAALEKPLRPIYLPVTLCRAVVPVLQRLPGFPLTMDQLTMLLEENVCSDSHTAYADLALRPIPFHLSF